MKVHVSYLILILFVMTLCQAAAAVERFDLLPCTERERGSGGMLYCTDHDSTGDISYLHDNITRRITIKLPIQVLTLLWLNQGGIAIVNPSGDAISNGQEFISSQNRDRWTIKFNFHYVNSDIGNLHLILHIKDVEYLDTQILRVEIKTQDNIFKTTEKIWIPVEKKSNGGDNDQEGEAAKTTENPVKHEDPSAILHARIEALQSEKEALQEERKTLIHYQTKYYHCLETKDALNETPKLVFELITIAVIPLIGMTVTV